MKSTCNAECVKIVVGKKAETYLHLTEFSSLNKSITCILIGKNTKYTRKTIVYGFLYLAVSFHISLWKV